MNRIPHRVLLLLAVLLLVVSGCGKKPEDDPQSSRPSIELQEVWELYRMYANEKRRPPARLADLQPYDAGYPLGFQAVQSGQCVVRWGTAVSSTADNGVLAHEKDVPRQGGWVLRTDGKVQQMTVQEFAEAAKAKK